MAITTSQQNRIDIATANVTSTKATYDSAQGTLTSLRSTADSIKASVHQCNGFRNRTVNFGTLNPGDCTACISNSNCPQCNTKNECQRRVREFNNAYENWNTQRATAISAETAYNNAKTALSEVLGAIEKESNSDPAVIIATKQIKAEQELGESALKSRTVQIVIFGVIALIIVGVMIAVLRR